MLKTLFYCFFWVLHNQINSCQNHSLIVSFRHCMAHINACPNRDEVVLHFTPILILGGLDCCAWLKIMIWLILEESLVVHVLWGMPLRSWPPKSEFWCLCSKWFWHSRLTSFKYYMLNCGSSQSHPPSLPFGRFGLSCLAKNSNSIHPQRIFVHILLVMPLRPLKFCAVNYLVDHSSFSLRFVEFTVWNLKSIS